VVRVLIAGLLILSQSGWVPAVAVRTSGLLSTGVTPAFATPARSCPRPRHGPAGRAQLIDGSRTANATWRSAWCPLGLGGRRATIVSALHA
jgi:hypothetical protein